ncbi:MAG: chloride channel protein [Candidatus Eremiobacteraeota bacterium]|nr:chloride channel protein [Candidatus Eremiobacteraeota bacterium]MBC5803187.1 chloride channel protein [Candidatus Eremiobacteraeota bacterium]MBC5825608.1 chloride channel protein [Candidatus Eremiobacteraeota bacterium]
MAVSPILKAAVGFGAVGVIDMWYLQVFGVGYNHIDAILTSRVPVGHSLILAALKPLATSLTLGAGGSGGVFAPSIKPSLTVRWRRSRSRDTFSREYCE